MKKVISILSSTRLMAVLFLVFAGAMAVATFIENDFGTPTARVMVFNAWWFEAIMILFVINFLGNIFKFNLWRKEKIVTLVFHLSFILILVGAGITRHISYEGLMLIKEGQQTNKMLTQKTFLQLHIDNDEVQKEMDKALEFSKFAPNFYNNFKINTDFKGQDIQVKYVDYIYNFEEKFTENENGEKYLHFVESTAGQRTDHYIADGEVKIINTTSVGFNTHSPQGINIIEQNGKFILETNEDGSYFVMKEQRQGLVFADSVQELNLLSLYTLQGLQFVVPELAVAGSFETISGEGGQDQLIVDVFAKDLNGEEQTKRLYLNGTKFSLEAPQYFTLAGLNFRMSYGSKLLEMPFAVKLRDFQLDKYPGSESPKSYASEVTVLDGKNVFDFRIFMNNILDYKGYRLFQSSYEITPDYEETRLSVNHDYWGTMITYIGYTLLYIGLMLIFFVPGSRYVALVKTLVKKVEQKKSLFTILFLFSTSFVFAEAEGKYNFNVDSLLEMNVPNIEQSEAFSKLIIQEETGRMQPFNTFSSKLLRKVSKKDTYRGYTADQISLSMVLKPGMWYFIPMIYIERGNTKVRDHLEIPHDQKYACLADFFNNKGEYKLIDEVTEAHKEQIKSKYQNDLVNIDKRMNLLYSALEGNLFRFFPKPNHENNRWYSFTEVEQAGFTGMDSTVAASILSLYSMELTTAKETGDYTNASKIVEGMHRFQTQHGGELMPSEKQINFEILYNKYDIFKKLFSYFLFASLILLILAIIELFSKSKVLNALININVGVIVVLFLMHTTGLAIRWYISGHAPWSNAYESMIYISWATQFFGLALGIFIAKRSSLIIGSVTFITSMMLMIAHWNWMDPSIGNLVPVLNSYWLMIHVSIIVASYGPFAVAMIISFTNLLLMSFTTEKNQKIMKLNIDILTIVSELALTLGLVLLTIGNFLGGQWANESWGRYWGWDPKETWALISIMVYAFVIHARFVPGLKSKFIFNVMAMFAFTSVLMTYLGVNHLLSGLHSYAAGEKAAIPNQIWGTLAVGLIVSLFAYYKHRKYWKKGL